MTSDQAAAAYQCPTCRERPALSAPSGRLGLLPCPRCRGALLPPRAAAALRALVGPAAAALDGALSARTTACPSCGAATPFVALAAGFASACGACATIWVDADLAAWAEARSRSLPASGPPPPAPPAPPGPAVAVVAAPASAPASPAGAAPAAPPAAWGAPPAVAPASASWPAPATGPAASPFPLPPAEPAWRSRAVLGAAAAAVVALAAWLALGRGPPADAPGLAPSHHRFSPVARAVVPADGSPAATAPAEEPAAAAAGVAASPGPDRRPPAEILVGGRSPEWWQRRLERLRASSDEATRALYEPTLERARAGGLVVTVNGSAVTVVPGPERLAAAGAAP